MTSHLIHSLRSLRLGLVLVFTLLMAATSLAEGEAQLTGKPLTSPDITVAAIEDQTYTGSQICPAISVTDGEKVLEPGVDFTIQCSNNVSVGTASMTITGKGNYTGEISEQFKIAKAPLIVIAKDKSIIYGDKPANAGVEYSGFVSVDNENSLSGSIVYSYDYAQYDKVGEYAIMPSGLESDNYEIEFVAGKLTVEPKEISIVWDDKETSFTYNGKAHAPNATAGGLLNNDECNIIIDSATNVGKYSAEAIDLTNINYKLPENRDGPDFEITKVPLTVTAKNATIAYGDEPSNAGVEYSGFVGDDNENDLNDSIVFNYDYAQFDKVGKYVIIPGGLSSDNYDITFVEGKLTVLPKKLTVTALNDTIVYGDEPSNAGVEFSGFTDGENEKSLNGTLVYSNEYKQYGNVGEYAITPSGLTADNYEIEFVAGKLTVEPKVVFIAWDDETSFTYDGKAHAPNAAAEGLVNNDKCNLVIDSATNAGKYTAKVTDLSNKNYKLPATGLEQDFEIAKIPLTVTAKNATIVYGDEPSNAGVEYSGFVVTDNEKSLNGSLVYSYDYKQYGNVGEYSVTPSGLTADNYEIEFVAGKLSVEPKEISVAWGESSFTYNGTEHVPAATASGVVNSDECIFTVTGAAANAGKYTAKVTDLSNKNYKLPATGLEQAFEITKANPTIVKSPVAVENLVYNGKAQTLVTAGEAKNGTLVYKIGDAEKYSETLPAATDAGDYTVYFMVLGDENYNDLKAETLTASIKVPVSSSSVIASSSSSAPASSSSTVEPGSSSSDSTTPVATTTHAGAFRVAYARNELVVTNTVASELKVAVFDVQGSLKMHYRGSAAGNHFVSLKKFVPGIYLVRVESSGKMQMLQVHVK